MISGLAESTKGSIAEEQGGLRRSRGCRSDICIEVTVEKYKENRKELCVAFMDLEKVYDKI